MWEIAPGFRPQMEGLTDRTRLALERLGERVRAMGGTLQLTSAYRPGDALLHGRGAAVDVWVPGWEPEQIKQAARGTGFIGGYVPHGGRRFIELVTQPYWYGVRQGDIFALTGQGTTSPAIRGQADAGAWGRQFEHFIDAGEMVRDVTPEEWVGIDEGIDGIGDRFAGGLARGGIILVAVVLFVVMLVLLVKFV